MKIAVDHELVTDAYKEGAEAATAAVVAYIEKRIELLSRETKLRYIALVHELQLFRDDLQAGKHIIDKEGK